MKFLTQKQCYRVFCRRVAEIHEQFGFDGWELAVEQLPQLDGHDAECSVLVANRTLLLRLCSKLPRHKRTRQEMIRLAEHEMCHAIMAPLFGLAEERHVTEEQLTAAHHEVVQRLMRGVFGRQEPWRV